MNFAGGLTWSHVEHSLVRILTLCLVQPVCYANLVFDRLIWSHWAAIDLKNRPSKGATRRLGNGGDKEAGATGLKCMRIGGAHQLQSPSVWMCDIQVVPWTHALAVIPSTSGDETSRVTPTIRDTSFETINSNNILLWYSSIPSSLSLCLHFQLVMAVRRSSMTSRLHLPQAPGQRYARIVDGDSQLQVKWRSWHLCE